MLWDIAGQELFASTRNAFYVGAEGIVYVYDVSRAETYEEIPKWLEEIKNSNVNVRKTILCANKSDLEHMVSPEKGKERADEFGMSFIETSAKTALRVDEAFETLAVALLGKKPVVK